MIYVTHDQIEALTLADRIAVMKGGVIQQLDDAADDLQPAGQPVRRRLHRLAVDELPRRAASRPGGERPRFEMPGFRCSLDGYDVARGAAMTAGRWSSASAPSTSTVGAAAGARTACQVEMVEPMGSERWSGAGSATTPISVLLGGEPTYKPAPPSASHPGPPAQPVRCGQRRTPLTVVDIRNPNRSFSWIPRQPVVPALLRPVHGVPGQAVRTARRARLSQGRALRRPVRRSRRAARRYSTRHGMTAPTAHVGLDRMRTDAAAAFRIVQGPRH